MAGAAHVVRTQMEQGAGPCPDLRAVTVPELLPAPGRAAPAHGWASAGHVTQAAFRGQDHENLQKQ